MGFNSAFKGLISASQIGRRTDLFCFNLLNRLKRAS